MSPTLPATISQGSATATAKMRAYSAALSAPSQRTRNDGHDIAPNIAVRPAAASVDTSTSKAHCGQCGLDCGPDPDAACCASACVHTGSDIKSCGGCGKACGFANAAASCNAGACKLGNCNPGFENCTANPADGCEVATASDTGNCGGCGRACSVPNGVPACIGGACALASSNAGHKNCDGMLGNGCETHVAVDPDNCGTCGSVCGKVPHAVAGCMNSACVVISCDAGFGNCDKQDNNGRETDITTTLAHCGACGNAARSPPM